MRTEIAFFQNQLKILKLKKADFIETIMAKK